MSWGNDTQLNPIPKKQSLVEDVVRELSNYVMDGIVNKGLNLGDRLPSERELSDILRVGRSTLREATKVLTFLGLLEVRTGQGTFITNASNDFYAAPFAWGMIIGEQSVAELVEARELLECKAATFAAKRASVSQRENLTAVFGDLESATNRVDVPAFIDADVRFHMIVADSAHNAVISKTIKMIRRLLEIWIQKVLTDPGYLSMTLDEHRAILDAVITGNADEAGRSMLMHIKGATQRLQSAWNWDMNE